MGAAEVPDVAAWALNVSTSVLIVFVNKWLMDPKWGYGFVFATTLCSLHFFASAATVKASEAMGFSQKAKLPMRDTLIFSAVAGASIAALNLSLLVNSVGFYQISKLMIIPFVCLVEYVSLGRRFTPLVLCCILVVAVGVGIVTVTELAIDSLTALGMLIAAISVVASGMQQIMCGTLQRKHQLTSTQMLSNTAPVQGLMLLFTGPLVDKVVTGSSIFAYVLTAPRAQCLALSCAVAVAVNISQFMCLGRFSAVTFQVLGHTKTILVLLAGWAFLGDVMTARKLGGMALAMAGMVAYGVATSRQGGGGATQAQPGHFSPATRVGAYLKNLAQDTGLMGRRHLKEDDDVSSPPTSPGGPVVVHAHADKMAAWRRGVESGEVAGGAAEAAHGRS